MGVRAPIRTLWVWRSANGKTGPTAATYRTQASCPTACPLRTITAEDAAARPGLEPRAGACYAENGAPAPFAHAARGADGPGIPEDAAERLPHGTAVRFNVSGDFLRADGTPDAEYMAAADALAAARPDGCAECAADPAARHVRTIAYTHAWRTIGPRAGSFAHTAPRASCDTIADVREARAAGWAAVITVPEAEAAAIVGRTAEDGTRFALCPAQGPRKLQCVDCMACARPDPAGPVIVFAAHGAARRRVLPVLPADAAR